MNICFLNPTYIVQHMRVETTKPGKKFASIIAVLMIVLLFSSQSMAGVVNLIKDEIDEHDILVSSDDTVAEKDTPTKSSKKYSSSGSSGINTGSYDASNIASSSGTSTSQAKKQSVNIDLFSLLKKYTEYYNNGIDEVPDVVQKIAGNDVILLEVAMNDKSDMRVKVRTEDGLITEFSKLSSISSGEDIEPTVTITSDENTIRSILKSDDPLGYFISSLNQGSLNIECKGFVKKAALSALKALG